MNPTICSRCKKNVAVVYITRLENGSTQNEGLCLKCAKELGIKPIDDVIAQTGLTTGKLLASLTMLELKGMIRRLPGKRICIK